MGKGQVVSHQGDGLYTVRLLFDRQRAEQYIAQLQARQNEISEKLTSLEPAVNDAESAMNSAASDLNQAIQDYNDAIGGDDEEQERQDLRAAQTAYLEARSTYVQALSEYRVWRLEQASVSKKISTLQRQLTEDVERSLWCADYTTDLSGEIGTVEIPGTRQHVQLRPGHDGAAVYEAARDGQLTPVVSMTPAQSFYNTAMLPGWQKWQPLYRKGTISSINYNAHTCDVDLDQLTSQAQELNVNQSSSLTGVPIDYMGCDAQAFEVGDVVLIEFENQDWESPKVVGFVDHPRPCPIFIKITINGQECSKAKGYTVVDGTGSELASGGSSASGIIELDGKAIEDGPAYLRLHRSHDGEFCFGPYYREVAKADAEYLLFSSVTTDTTDDGWKTLYFLRFGFYGASEEEVPSGGQGVYVARQDFIESADLTQMARQSFQNAEGEEVQGWVVNFTAYAHDFQLQQVIESIDAATLYSSCGADPGATYYSNPVERLLLGHYQVETWAERPSNYALYPSDRVPWNNIPTCSYASKDAFLPSGFHASCYWDQTTSPRFVCCLTCEPGSYNSTCITAFGEDEGCCIKDGDAHGWQRWGQRRTWVTFPSDISPVDPRQALILTDDKGQVQSQPNLTIEAPKFFGVQVQDEEYDQGEFTGDFVAVCGFAAAEDDPITDHKYVWSSLETPAEYI